MSDLIRREDALLIRYDEGWLGDSFNRIRALPAVQPGHVNETPKSEHDTANMLTLTAERDRLREALRDGRRLWEIARDDRIRLLIQLEQCEASHE